MQWGFRWYGEGDTIPLTNIRQIPGMHGIVGTLLNKMPGDVWEISEINALKASIEKEHLSLLGLRVWRSTMRSKLEQRNGITTSINIFKRFGI